MANFKKGDIVYYTVWNEDSEMEFRSGEIEGIDIVFSISLLRFTDDWFIYKHKGARRTAQYTGVINGRM